MLKNAPPLLEQVSDTLLTAAPLSITDLNGTIVWANQSFCNICGYFPEELIGKNHSLLQSGIHDNAFYKNMWDTISSNHAWEGEMCNRKKDGQLYWDRLIIIPILGQSSKPTQYVAYHTDVTERKGLIDSVRRRAHQQGLLALLSRSATLGKDLFFIIDQFCVVVTHSLEMDTGMIFEQTDSDELTLRSACGQKEGVLNQSRIKIKTGDLVNFIYQNTGITLSEDLRHDQRFHTNDFILAQDASHCRAFPLGKQDTPWGIFICLSSNEHHSISEDLIFLDSVKNLLTETITVFQYQNALTHERDLSQKYLDMAQVMFIVIDINERIILANKKASRLLGYKQNELPGMNWFENFIPEITRASTREYFNKLATNQICDITTDLTTASPVLTREGSIRLVKWSHSIITDNNKNATSILIAGEDITDQLKAEKEREQLQQQLHQAKKMEAIGHLVSGIAHDFNNILASILGYTTLATEKFAQNNGKLANYLKEIENAGIRARDIVAQLSSYNKSGSESNTPVLLPTLVKGTLKMLRAAIPSSVSLKTDVNTNTPGVTINASEFNQIILHLLLNACNAMYNKGEIILKVDTQHANQLKCMNCHTMLVGDHVCLSILDSSPCPSEDKLTHALNGENPAKADLVEASALIHASGGHLIVTPDSHGTCTRVLFPIRDQQTTPISHPVKPVKTQTNILIVDDENSVATYLGELLHHAGYQTTTFTDATEALKSFVSNTAKYDLVITDQTMPMISGYDLAQAMLQVRSNLPIILITGANDNVTIKQAENIGIRHVLGKPIETQNLLESINSLLNETLTQ